MPGQQEGGKGSCFSSSYSRGVVETSVGLEWIVARRGRQKKWVEVSSVGCNNGRHLSQKQRVINWSHNFLDDILLSSEKALWVSRSGPNGTCGIRTTLTEVCIRQSLCAVTQDRTPCGKSMPCLVFCTIGRFHWLTPPLIPCTLVSHRWRNLRYTTHPVIMPFFVQETCSKLLLMDDLKLCIKRSYVIVIGKSVLQTLTIGL